MKPYRTTHNGRVQWCVKWWQCGKYRRVYADTVRVAYEKQVKRIPVIEREAADAVTACEHDVGKARRRVGTKGNPTVEQAVDKWLQGSERIGDASRNKYRNNYRNHLHELIGGLAVKSLTTDQCSAAFAALRGQRIGDSAYFHTWTEFNACMNWLVKHKTIRRNPMDGLDKPSRVNKVSVRDDKNIERMETTVVGIVNWLAEPGSEYHHYLGLVLALNLGLRRAEVLGITTEMISRSSMTLQVCNQLEMRAGGAYIKPSTKGHDSQRRGRTVPLPPAYYKVLIELADKREHDDNALVPVELNGQVIDHQHLLFMREDGKPYSYNDLRNIWIEIQRMYKRRVLHDMEPLSEDERIRLHANRHVACSLLAAQGVTLQMIQAILGHLTPSMTEHYTHWAVSQLRGVTENYADSVMNESMRNFVRQSEMLASEK